MTDLASCKAQAIAFLDKHASCVYHYEVEISEAEKSYSVIRVCELANDEAAEMGVRCPPEDEVVLEASSEIELYRKVITQGGP